jgi:hypothetical protein
LVSGKIYSLSLSPYLSIHPCTWQSTNQSIYLSTCLPIYLSIHLSIYLCMNLSIHLSIYLFLPHPIVIRSHHPKPSPSWNNRKASHVGLSGPWIITACM